MPKLHFYDTGLACWLLGIRDTSHLRAHPLRGSIFETWVVSEILKHRVNLGKEGSLYHYRDRNGIESDLVIDHPTELRVVEAKAGPTVAGDLLEGALKGQRSLASDRQCTTYVIYGGEAKQQRRDVTLLPWSKLHESSWG